MSIRDPVRLRTLQRAETILGTEGLREYLRVPMRHLDAWMSGKEPLPADIFLKVVDLVLDHDLPPRLRKAHEATPATGDGEKFRVKVGPNFARCPACDCNEFRAADPAEAMSALAALVCAYCGHRSVRGDLVVAAADEGAKRSAAALLRLKKMRQAARDAATGSSEASEDSDTKKEN